MDKTDESFGQKLRGRRRQRALTQAGLADMLGVAEKTVGKNGNATKSSLLHPACSRSKSWV